MIFPERDLSYYANRANNTVAVSLIVCIAALLFTIWSGLHV